MERFEFIKAKAPELMKNVKLDFADGKFTASSTTKAIDQLSEIELKQLGSRGETIKNFFIKEMPDALTIDSKSGRITNINDTFISKPTKWNKFVNSLPVKLVKGVSKAGARTLGAAMPVIGPGMVAWGISDVNKAHAAGLTDPDEMTVAYNFGPEIAQMWSDYKAKEMKPTLAGKEGLPEIDAFAAKDGGLSGVDQYILNRYK